MKILLLADLHLHHLPRWRLDWCEQFVETVTSKYGYPGSGFDLYILGDVLEIRDKVDSRVLNLLINLIKNWKSGDVVWMSGQHDSYVPGRATLHEISDFQLDNGKVVIVDHRTVEHKGNWLVPFQRKDEDYRKLLEQVPDNSTVFTHLPLVEILEKYGAKNVKGIRLKEFARFKRVYSGDIHKYEDLDNFSYIGAPGQRDWRDKGLEGQIATLIDGEFTRIPTEHPKHIEVNSEDDIPKEGLFIVKSKRGSNVHAVNAIEVVETADINLESVELRGGSKSKQEQIEAYLEQNSPPTDKKQAKDYADKILGEGQ
jgi:hypothetical protein